MKHLKVISRAQIALPQGTSLLETILIVLLTIFFSDWDNFIPVIQNLEKFYGKT